MQTADHGGAGRYLVALGSNMRHPRFGPPAQVLAKAMEWLDGDQTRVISRSPIYSTPPLGPSLRRYANAVCILESDLVPGELLVHLQAIEEAMGRRRQGQRWGRRVLDLDIVLWSGGSVHTKALQIPHRELARRDFVLRPACRIVGDWKVPGSGLSLKHLHARLTRPRPLPR